MTLRTEWLRRMIDEQKPSTLACCPRQAGPFRVEALVSGDWKIEYVPTREQAVRRVQVFWSWGAEVAKVTNTARYQ